MFGIISTLKNLQKIFSELDNQSIEIRKQSDEIRNQSDTIGKQSDEIRNQSDTIVKQSDEIEKQFESVGKQSDEIRNQSDTIVKQSDEIEKQFESIGKQSDEIRNQSDTIVKQSDEIEKQFESVGKQSDEIRNQSDTIVKQSDEIEKQFESIVKQSDEIEKQFESIGKQSDEIRNQSDTIVKQSDEIEKQFESIVKQSDEIRNQSDTIVKQSDEIEKQFESIGKQSDEIRNQSDTIGKQSDEIEKLFKSIVKQSDEIRNQLDTIGKHSNEIRNQSDTIGKQSDEIGKLISEIKKLIEIHAESSKFSLDHLSSLSHHSKRNILPNDDSALQKNIIASWRLNKKQMIGYKDFLDSGFRVFSQNDEDGILLRIFSQIESTNKYVVEIGSNCSGSDIGIPENNSTNLIVNHGWNGSIFEIDEVECEKTTNFYANHLSTKHFHNENNGINSYYSPQIIQGGIYAENINEKMNLARIPSEPDLMIIDIDGDDYFVYSALKEVRPRVLVVEFEKRFRDKFNVVQTDKKDFSKKWVQSGSTSLNAWTNLLSKNNYILCAISSIGFNAFFVRIDAAADKIIPLRTKDAFDLHPIFSCLPDDFWFDPDDTWEILN